MLLERIQSKSVLTDQIGEDVYGFNFNGSTSITGYTEVSTPYNNTGIYFEYIQQNTPASEEYIVWSRSTTNGFSTPYYYVKPRPTGLMIFGESAFTYFSEEITIIQGELYRIFIRFLQDEIRFYVNGSLVATDSFTNASTNDWVFQTDSNTRFGGSYSGGNYTQQLLGNFSIYSTALTEQEAIDMTSGSDLITTNRVFYESFNQETQGTITGAEQYALIEQNAEYKASSIFTPWFYGGTLSISNGNNSTKTVKLYVYSIRSDGNGSYFLARTATGTGESIDVELPDSEYRRILIEVMSNSDFSEITINMSGEYNVLENNDSITNQTYIEDMQVFYGNNISENKTLTFRVDKTDKKFRSITSDKVYIDGVKYEVKSVSLPQELDNTRYQYGVQLERLL